MEPWCTQYHIFHGEVRYKELLFVYISLHLNSKLANQGCSRYLLPLECAQSLNCYPHLFGLNPQLLSKLNGYEVMGQARIKQD